MRFSEFLNECREKDVFKSLSIYIVSSWVLLQVVSLLAEPLNLPNSALTILLLLLLVGFPLYTFFIWQFRIKPAHALKQRKRETDFETSHASSKNAVEIDIADQTASAKDHSLGRFQKMYFVGLGVIGLLSLFSAVFIVKTNFFKEKSNAIDLTSLANEDVSDKIAILNFDNNTGNEQYEVVSKMAVDWIMHGITQNKIAQVMSPKIIEDYSNVLKASMLPDLKKVVVTDYLKPSKIINGSFYLKNNRLLFQSSITDSKMDKTLVSFPSIECDSDSPLDCVENLTQRVLSYLETEDTPLDSWEESPPKYEAYKSLLDARTKYDDDGEYLRLVEKAIAIDSTYFEAKVSLLEFNYNKGNYNAADSLINLLSKSGSDNTRQWNLLKMYESLLVGNNGNTYKYLTNEYSINPFSLDTKTSLMTIALQFVNRPEDVQKVFDASSIFSKQKERGLSFNDCAQCRFGYYIKALSDIELGSYQSAIDLLEPYVNNNESNRLKEALLSAYVRIGKDEKVENLLVNSKLLMSESDWRRLSFLAAREYLLVAKIVKASVHLQNIINSLEEQNELTDGMLMVLGRAYFYLEDYSNAEKYLNQYRLTKPQNRLYDYLSALAICYDKLGNKSAVDKVFEELENNRDDYNYGHIDYAYAQYYTATSQNEMALESLYKAVSDGKWYTPDAYLNDILLQPLKDTEDFKKILKFWN